MSANYCPNCGEGVQPVDEYCRNCGVEVDRRVDIHTQQTGRVFYFATLLLFIGWITLFAGGHLFQNDLMFALAFIAWVVSLVTFYLDLRRLDGQLLDTDTHLWVLAGILLYVVILPYYLYKRWDRHPPEVQESRS